MIVARFPQEFFRIIAIVDADERKAQLADFLDGHGFYFAARSADNIILIQQLFPVETVHRIVVDSLRTPLPDLALNSFERLAGVIPEADLSAIARRRKSLMQFVRLCGSSPFLVNQIYKTPEAVAWLFLDNAIALARTAD